MYIEESPYQRDQLINIEQLIGRCLDHGVDLGDNHQQTIENYVQNGLVPRLMNGDFPATALDRVVFIDQKIKEGKSVDEIKKLLEDERRKFLSQPSNSLESLVETYSKASKSLLMISSLLLLLFFSTVIISVNVKNSITEEFVTKPVGKVLAAAIKSAVPKDANSADPLGLTNISQIITIKENKEVVIEKTVIETASTEEAPPAANTFLSLDKDGNLVLTGDITIDGVYSGNGSGLTNLPLPETMLTSTGTYENPTWLTSLAWSKITGKPNLLASVDGVTNDLGNIDLVAGTGVTITSDDSANTITFNLAGSGVNADLLDSLDSTSFLRSDTSDNFTSGTLTINAGTTLDVLGTFTCTSCIADSAVSDTITVSNYLPLSGGTLSGALDVNSSIQLGNQNQTLDTPVAGVISTSADLRVVGNDIQGSGGTSLINLSTLTLQGGSWDFTDSTVIAYTTTPGTGNTTNLTINSTNNLTIGTDVNLVGIDIDVDNSANGTGQPLTEGINVYAQYSSDDVGVNIYGIRTIAHFNPSDWATAVDLVGLSVQTQCCGASPFNPTNIVGIRIETPTGTAGTGLLIKDQSGGAAIVTEGTSSSSFGGSVSIGGLLSASTSSTSNVGFRLNTAQAAPSCASLTNGDFGFDSSNNRIFWKGTGGTCSYWNRTGTFDIAEHAPATEHVEPGDLLVVDESSTSFSVKKSSQPYQRTLIGMESSDPTLISNPDLLGTQKFVSKLALAGRVPTKVSTENGAIKIGDYLTSSSTPGVAMKATSTGPTIGKALEAYSGSGISKIMVFIDNSFYVNLDEAPTQTLASDSYVNNFIDQAGQAVFSKITAAFASFQKLVFGEIAVQKDSGSAGTSTLHANTTEVFVSSSKVKSDSLINLTPNSEPEGILYIKEKIAGHGFVVGLKQLSQTSSQVSFSWFILNQE